MRIEIFKPGKHTATNGAEIDFSEAMVAQIAANYDVAKHEAPLVIGHPKTDHPAWGWVKSVSFAEGKLTVEDGEDTEPAFAEIVKAGRYKKRSASFYAPGQAGNPTPEAFYLKHVGFLGAVPPSVKGMGAVQFAQDEAETVTVEFADAQTGWALSGVASVLRSLRDWMLAKSGQEEADKALPSYVIDQIARDAQSMQQQPEPALTHFSEPEIKQESTVTEAEAKKLAEENAALKAANEKQAAEFTEFKAAQAKTAADARRAEIVAFADAQVKAGKLLPKDKAGVVDFAMQLDAQAEVSFGEGDGASKQTPLAWFKGFLAGAQKAVEFGEFAGEGRAPAGDGVDPKVAALVANAGAKLPGAK